MKRIATATAATFLAATAAFAQSADVSSIQCSALATMDTDGITTLMFWIDGFTGGLAQDPTFDLDRLGKNIEGAMAICANNPDMTVMDALHQTEQG